MVGFPSDISIDEHDQASKLKNLSSTSDASLLEAEVFPSSFADSFIDFDSMEEWVKEFPDTNNKVGKENLEPGVVERPAEMNKNEKTGTEGFVQDPIVVQTGDGPGCVVKVQDESLEESCVDVQNLDGSEKLQNMSCSIEAEMGKVSLFGASECLVVDDDGDALKRDKLVGSDESSDTDAESESASSSSAPSSTGDDEEEEEGQVMEKAVAISGKTEEVYIMDSEVEGSSSSASSSSSDDDEEEEEEKEMGQVMKKAVAMEGEFEEGEIMDSDVEEMVGWVEEDDGGSPMRGPIRSKNEVEDLPLVPPVNVVLQPHHQTLPVGVVLSVMGAQVIVEGVAKHNPLSEGSILWITVARTPLGFVDEIFGPVKNPYYKVRYNSQNEVPSGIHEGTLVSFVSEFANYALNDSNVYKKGYDASGDNDEEISNEIEFSDDEKEAEYKRMLKMTKRGTDDQRTGNRKNNRKKIRNRDKSQKDGGPTVSQAAVVGTCQLHPGSHQNQHQAAEIAASLNHGNGSNSLGSGQMYTGGMGQFPPPFPQPVQATGFSMLPSGIWPNGVPYQQQPSMMFPNGPPACGMVWPQFNQHQPPHQMPFPNGMPFQPQFDQKSPSGVLPQYGQPKFSAGTTYTQYPGALGQGAFDPTLGMGSNGQHEILLNRPPIDRNSDWRPLNAIQDNNQASQQFNTGTESPSYRGKKPYHQGLGHFRGGRGSRGGRGFQGGRGCQRSN